jgi:16S rRNA (cytidine1402-2'-O)-methyltransferase
MTTSTPEPCPPPAGSLVLVPSPLDFGIEGVEGCDIQDQLPLGTLRRAAAMPAWLVENARSARAFLKRVDAVLPLARPLQQTPITELPRPRKGSQGAATPAELDALLRPAIDGGSLGLLSEAGLPGVADPGAELVARAHALGLRVDVLPGASALSLALAASGLNGQQFRFVGYVPQEPAAREKVLRQLEQESARLRQTQLMIEAPYRNGQLFSAMLNCLQADTRLSVAQALASPAGQSLSRPVAKWRLIGYSPSNALPCVFALLAA